MIVLHRGVDKNNIMHIGYATVINGVARIITLRGESLEVKRDSLQPIMNDGVYREDIGALANGDVYKVHDIQSVEEEIGICVIRELRHKGIHFVEDLQYWTVEDFMRLRGVGEKKAEKIVKVLKNIQENYYE